MNSGLTFEEHDLIGCIMITRYKVGLVMHYASKVGYVYVIGDWFLLLCVKQAAGVLVQPFYIFTCSRLTLGQMYVSVEGEGTQQHR